MSGPVRLSACDLICFSHSCGDDIEITSSIGIEAERAETGNLGQRGRRVLSMLDVSSSRSRTRRSSNWSDAARSRR